MLPVVVVEPATMLIALAPALMEETAEAVTVLTTTVVL
jgi:hypothetical protein